MWLLLALSILCGAGACVGRRASISNQLPRRDTQGRILDAHDGSLVQHHAGGRFYLYGTSYGPNCTITPNPCSLTYGSCGWRNNNFSAYSTADFQTWTREAESLIPVDQRPDGIYFRPKVVYNRRTNRYVLWYNFIKNESPVGGRSSVEAVAVADAPTGPFRIVNGNVSLLEPRAGDFDVFVDDDAAATAYLIYTAYSCSAGAHGDNCRTQLIQVLSEDYLRPLATSAAYFPWADSEAPWMGKVDGVYHVLFDRTCCFCTEGSGAVVWTAPHPMGPYAPGPNINRDAAGRPTVAAQQTFVARVPGPGGAVQWLWLADRWNSAPDGQKAHDFQFWHPLRVANGTFAPISWVDGFVLDLPDAPGGG